jgi:hypothetical protein
MAEHPYARLRRYRQHWTEAGLTLAEVDVLTAGYLYADGAGVTFVSTARLADELGVTPRRVRVVMAKAARLGVITAEVDGPRVRRRYRTYPVPVVPPSTCVKPLGETVDNSTDDSYPVLEVPPSPVPVVPPYPVPVVPLPGTPSTAIRSTKGHRSNNSSGDNLVTVDNPEHRATVENHLIDHMSYKGDLIRNPTAYAKSQRPAMLAADPATLETEWPTRPETTTTAQPTTRTTADGRRQRFSAGTGWITDLAATATA